MSRGAAEDSFAAPRLMRQSPRDPGLAPGARFLRPYGALEFRRSGVVHFVPRPRLMRPPPGRQPGLFFPVFYGLIGAVGGLIMAGLYNVAAKYAGGIDVEIA